MKKKYKLVLKVPKTPKSAYDHGRFISRLIEHQIKHFHDVEKSLLRIGQKLTDISKIKTELHASKYLKKMTALQHPQEAVKEAPCDASCWRFFCLQRDPFGLRRTLLSRLPPRQRLILPANSTSSKRVARLSKSSRVLRNSSLGSLCILPWAASLPRTDLERASPTSITRPRITGGLAGTRTPLVRLTDRGARVSISSSSIRTRSRSGVASAQKEKRNRAF